MRAALQEDVELLPPLKKPPPETPTTPVEDDVEEDDGPSWTDVDDDDLNDVNDEKDREGERIREDLDLGERIQAILAPREGAQEVKEEPKEKKRKTNLVRLPREKSVQAVLLLKLALGAVNAELQLLSDEV